MGDAPDSPISLAASLESIEDPCGDNPFQPDDPRWQSWAEATRKAEEDLYSFWADLLQRMNAIPRSGNFQEQFFELWIESFTGAFGIWAQRGVYVVRGNAAIKEYDRWISSYLVAILATARGKCPELYPRDRLIAELQYQLLPRLQHWKAAARRHSREIDAQTTQGEGQGIHQAGIVTARFSDSQSAPPTAPIPEGPTQPGTIANDGIGYGSNRAAGADTEATSAQREAQATVNAGNAALASPARRKPDLETSRERMKLLDCLSCELATIKPALERYCTPTKLKAKYPEFKIWSLLSQAEVQELVKGETFTPKVYAENLVLRRFGITNRETLKKDRKKLRKAGLTAK